MTGIQHLFFFWVLLISHSGNVHSDVRFLDRLEGQSVVISCVIDPQSPRPFGIYLRRSRRQDSKVIYKHNNKSFTVGNDLDKNRISVSGEPADHSVNVTISDLRRDDTDRYVCEFVVENQFSVDEKIPGKTEVLLLVDKSDPGTVDMELLQTCAGGSASLPCQTAHEDGQDVAGVSLVRQRSLGPVELVYQSTQPFSSALPAERVQFSSALGPGGLTHTLTLLRLQPEDSALYSCHLLLPGRPQGSGQLGRKAVFVSVHGGACGCSHYPAVLYALSAAAGLLLLLLFSTVVYKCQRGAQQSKAEAHPHGPIYEEMVGVNAPMSKSTQNHLAEVESSPKRNCPENHYESPRRAPSNI